MKNPERWKQRFKNFEKAFLFFKKSVQQEEYSKLEESGLIQAFEFSFELAWKTLKDKLEFEGFEVPTPRETIKMGFQTGYLVEVKGWLEALDKRNEMSHTYDEKESHEIFQWVRKTGFQQIELLYESLKSKLYE